MDREAIKLLKQVADALKILALCKASGFTTEGTDEANAISEAIDRAVVALLED